MQKAILLVTFFFSMQLTAWTRSVDWEAWEEEACLLEQAIRDCDQTVFPVKDFVNKDPETKMPEKGFHNGSDKTSIYYFPDLCLLTPFVHAINCFSGFTNQANAP